MVEVEPECFEGMVAEVLDGLPEELGQLVSNVAVTVEHRPGPPCAELISSYWASAESRRP